MFPARNLSLCSVFLFQTGFPLCVCKNGTSSAGLHSTSNINPSGKSSPKLIQKKILGSSLIQLGMCLVIIENLAYSGLKK